MPDNFSGAWEALSPALLPMQAGLFFLLMLFVSVWDLCVREIPDRLQLAIAALTFLYFSPVNLLGVLGAVPYFVVALFFHEMDGMGGGDIKLTAATGAVLGLPMSLLSSVIGLGTFIVYSTVYMAVVRLRGRKGRIAFPVGPFLALGAAVAYFIKNGGRIV